MRCGELVPDELVAEVFRKTVQEATDRGELRPEVDLVLLDAYPRDVDQAKSVEADVTVERVFYLNARDEQILAGQRQVG